MCQPPCAGGSFLARRWPTVPQSSAVYWTFMPILFSRSAVTSPCALVIGDVGRHQQDDRLVLIPGLGQQLLRAVVVALALQRLAAILGIQRRVRREEARDRLPQRGILADHGAHVVCLAERDLHRPARPHVVERRIQVVDAERSDIAERIGDIDLEVRRLSSAAAQGRTAASPTSRPRHSAARPRRCRHRAGCATRSDRNTSACRRPASSPARHAARSRRISRTRPSTPGTHSSRLNRIGPEPTYSRDLLERIGLRDALRHDEQAGRAALAQREQHLRIGLVQPEAEGPVVHGLQRVGALLDRHAHRRVAHHPAVDAGDARRAPAPACRRGISGPSRSLKVQVLKSGLASWLSTICGCGSSLSLTPYSVSQISSEPLRTTYCVVQIGSRFARLACGTKCKTLLSAARASLGMAKPPAAASDPAVAVFRKSRRCIACSVPVQCSLPSPRFGSTVHQTCRRGAFSQRRL